MYLKIHIMQNIKFTFDTTKCFMALYYNKIINNYKKKYRL